MKLTHGLKKQFTILILLQTVWALLSIGLVVWWGTSILTRQRRIYELETQILGFNESLKQKLLQTQNMIYWEGAVFISLIAFSFGLSWYLFLKEKKRTHSLQTFFASITHELKTPLSSIRLQAESIEDQMVDSPLVKRLIEDTHRLETQLDRSLELARIEGGGRVYLQEVDFLGVLKRVIDHLGAFGKEKVMIAIDAKRFPIVLADQSALMTVLKNLIENSVKHSGKKPVGIHIEVLESGKTEVVISIRDDGVGSGVDFKRLGELFYKGPKSTGAGVGLYLVSSLMEKMGGVAEFRKHPDGFQTVLTFRTGGSL
jgi:signal transduction histidine kinase